MNKAIVVIGGGAGGMMAAICAARKGAHVTLLDPNERLGKKVNITGKGRCNVTNDSTCEELLAHVPQNPRFLYSVFSRFDGHDAIDFFEGLGVPLKVERGKRVFPVSDRSFDITAALERELKRLHVKLVRDRALGISVEDGHVAAVKGEKGDYTASAVILATGGLSYPATGSTGDGFRMVEALGHTVTPLRGSLVPLEARECAVLQGLSLRNVALTVYENNKKIHSDFGEMLFTHFGVSGPLILSASAHMRHFDKKQYRLEIDLKPALDEQMLDKRLLSDFEKHANSDYCNVLGTLLPQKMIDEFIDRSGIPPHEKVHDITRAQRETIRTLLKRWTVNVSAPMPVENAIITSGGVKVGEIDPKTMASKKVPGLYFAGQMTGVEGYIESAASGMLAGIDLALKLNGEQSVDFGSKTAIGALGRYVSCYNGSDFQPMNISFGIIEGLSNAPRNKQERYTLIAERSLKIIDSIAEKIGINGAKPATECE